MSQPDPEGFVDFETGIGFLAFGVLVVETVHFIAVMFTDQDHPTSSSNRSARLGERSGNLSPTQSGMTRGDSVLRRNSSVRTTLASEYFEKATLASIAGKSIFHVIGYLIVWPMLFYGAGSLSALLAGRRAIATVSGSSGSVKVWVLLCVLLEALGIAGATFIIAQKTRIAKLKQARSFARTLTKEFGANTDESGTTATSSDNTGDRSGSMVIDITNMDIPRSLSSHARKSSMIRFGET